MNDSRRFIAQILCIPCCRLRHRAMLLPAVIAAVVAVSAPSAHAVVDRALEEARQDFRAGKYDESRKTAQRAIAQGAASDDWAVLKAEAELTTGDYATAIETADAGLRRFPDSLPLRLLAARACQRLGQAERTRTLLREMERAALRTPWRYNQTDDLLALGEAALMAGANPQEVQQGFFERARRLNPTRREPLLALARLALEQQDHQGAAAILEGAVRRFPDDADFQFSLAMANGGGAPEKAEHSLERALLLNPNHLAALLMKADQLIDRERLDEARVVLDHIKTFNPHEPDAWALRAVLAHLQSDAAEEAACRQSGLKVSPQNPSVDHLIGLKLSQKYRFAEGAAYQRRALTIDANFLPARIQLCQDLLRLGEETEAWALADSVYKANRHDVIAYNLIELRDRIAKFRTLENEDFVVRMDAEEAEVYGERVLALLTRAKQVLAPKYGVELKSRITVEIYPDESDFAVRTFGIPGTSGFLGVCFGKVITANSPASMRDGPCNWEAVLWHEFCHVVTLELTRNKMPRWLSEGISVYEEIQADATWGQKMSPKFREIILSGQLTSVADLSGSFLAAQNSPETEFAYFQSALLVEYLVETYGHPALCAVLRDLGNGLLIGEALERNTDALAKLDAGFREFAAKRAHALAPRVDWNAPAPNTSIASDLDALKKLAAQNPRNYWALAAYAGALLERGEWEGAKAPLQQMLRLYPGYSAADNAYEMLALAHRELGEESQERRLLTKYTALDSSAIHAFLRLMELEADAGNWRAVRKNAERAIAVNPMLPQPYRALAEAAEELGDSETAIAACRTLLAMNPGDPAAVHYRLARLLHHRQDPLAKQHALAALEEAPRFRAAHRLLQEMTTQAAVSARD